MVPIIELETNKNKFKRELINVQQIRCVREDDNGDIIITFLNGDEKKYNNSFSEVKSRIRDRVEDLNINCGANANNLW